MSKLRLDKLLVVKGLSASRSQAEDLIRRGFVKVNDEVISKPGSFFDQSTIVKLTYHESFVSRAGEKLNSVVDVFKLNFQDKTVLDVGSSTGGFTELSLRKGASKVIAVEQGTNQMDSSLRNNLKVELHEKTDIRDFNHNGEIDIVVIDVSFISLREILPKVRTLASKKTIIVAMVKPQFEAVNNGLKHKGVIKNDKIRRDILKDFENWTRTDFYILAKADSAISGVRGNIERFYLLSSL